jgi:hypothetical protein
VLHNTAGRAHHPWVIDPAERIVRWVLLIPVLVGSLVGTALDHAPHRPASDLFAADHAGQLKYLKVTNGPVQKALWSTGPLTWAISSMDTTTGTDPLDGKPVPQHNLREAGYEGPAVSTLDGPGESSMFWAPVGRYQQWQADTVVNDSRAVFIVCWLIAFVMMLGHKQTRVGNRWCWFWLFTAGHCGAVFYLLLEQQPLWARYRRTVPRTQRYKGWSGLLLCIPANIAIAIAGYGLAWLFLTS